jgi:A/G-specific adenine glycosylase
MSPLLQSQEYTVQYLSIVKLQWFRHQLTPWTKQHFRDFPWRRTTDPYAIFVAEFLLQKTEASKVVPIYQAFISRYPSLKTLAIASVEEIAQLLQPLGFYFRAQRLHESAQDIVEKYEGKIPKVETQLLALPGVGKYTARSICANAFGQPLAVLDTNVARILERFFGLQGNRVKSRCKMLWKAADELAPDTEVGKWNLTLLDFGAIVCTAKKPYCVECPLKEHCNYIN